MKEPIFPIVQVDGNKIISTEGVQSCFYKINPSDLEQFDPRERANFWEHISNWMNHLDGKEWFKLYFQNGNAYINSSVSDLSVPSGLSILPVKRPLKTFFGHDEIISDVCFYDNYLTYNGDYVRILSVVEFPDSDVDEGFLPHGVDYVLNFRRIEKEKSIQKIENIRQNHLSSFQNKKGIFREKERMPRPRIFLKTLSSIENLFLKWNSILSSRPHRQMNSISKQNNFPHIY